MERMPLLRGERFANILQLVGVFGEVVCFAEVPHRRGKCPVLDRVRELEVGEVHGGVTDAEANKSVVAVVLENSYQIEKTCSLAFVVEIED